MTHRCHTLGSVIWNTECDPNVNIHLTATTLRIMFSFLFNSSLSIPFSCFPFSFLFVLWLTFHFSFSIISFLVSLHCLLSFWFFPSLSSSLMVCFPLPLCFHLLHLPFHFFFPCLFIFLIGFYLHLPFFSFPFPFCFSFLPHSCPFLFLSDPPSLYHSTYFFPFWLVFLFLFIFPFPFPILLLLPFPLPYISGSPSIAQFQLLFIFHLRFFPFQSFSSVLSFFLLFFLLSFFLSFLSFLAITPVK